MVIQFIQKGDFTIMNVTKIKGGQLDFSNVLKLREKFNQLLEEKKYKVALNLKNIKYIDSSIIGFIVDALNTLRNIKNGEFILLNVDKKIIEILNMSNLTKFLKIIDEEDLK